MDNRVQAPSWAPGEGSEGAATGQNPAGGSIAIGGPPSAGTTAAAGSSTGSANGSAASGAAAAEAAPAAAKPHNPGTPVVKGSGASSARSPADGPGVWLVWLGPRGWPKPAAAGSSGPTSAFGSDSSDSGPAPAPDTRSPSGAQPGPAFIPLDSANDRRAGPVSDPAAPCRCCRQCCRQWGRPQHRRPLVVLVRRAHPNQAQGPSARQAARGHEGSQTWRAQARRT